MRKPGGLTTRRGSTVRAQLGKQKRNIYIYIYICLHAYVYKYRCVCVASVGGVGCRLVGFGSRFFRFHVLHVFKFAVLQSFQVSRCPSAFCLIVFGWFACLLVFRPLCIPPAPCFNPPRTHNTIEFYESFPTVPFRHPVISCDISERSNP